MMSVSAYLSRPCQAMVITMLLMMTTSDVGVLGFSVPALSSLRFRHGPSPALGRSACGGLRMGASDAADDELWASLRRRMPTKTEGEAKFVLPTADQMVSCRGGSCSNLCCTYRTHNIKKCSPGSTDRKLHTHVISANKSPTPGAVSTSAIQWHSNTGLNA